MGSAASRRHHPGGRCVAEGVHGGDQERRRRQGAVPALDDQVDDGTDGYAQSEHHQERGPRQCGQTGPAERHRSNRACRARTDPRRPAASAHGVLARQEQATEEHEDQGERAGGGLVEPDLELAVDLGGQRLVAQDLERTELSQHDEADQDRPSEDRRAGLSDGDRPEGVQAAETEAAGHLLLRRVRRAQAGGHGQEHQWVDRQGHHQDGGPEPADGGEHATPAEAHHEVGDAQRDHHQDRKEAAARQVGALHEPGGQRPDGDAQEHDHDDQRHGVPHQHGGEVPEEELVQLGPAHLHRLDDQEHERQEHHDRDEDGGSRQQRREAAVPRPRTSPRRSGHRSCASCRSLIASAPVPSSAIVIPFGWSVSNGVSWCAAVTPDAMGYS